METRVTVKGEEYKVSVDVEEFIKARISESVYLHTFNGYKKVHYIQWPDTDPKAICKDDNGGFGMEYQVSYDTPLYFESYLKRAEQL